jgi:tRNA threonylcarbamoyladenosine biosynthesis protein TsaE
MELSFSLNDIKAAAASFWEMTGNATVFAFHGTMGSGKTTFIHALCDVKQVKDVVGSPTFSIINQYNYTEQGIEKRIFHIDLYRLKDEDEVIRAGVEDCLYSEAICLVEWPEKAVGLLPADALHIAISITGQDTRKLLMKG